MQTTLLSSIRPSTKSCVYVLADKSDRNKAFAEGTKIENVFAKNTPTLRKGNPKSILLTN